MKVRQAMLTYWEVTRLIRLLDSAPDFNQNPRDVSLRTKLQALHQRFFKDDESP